MIKSLKFRDHDLKDPQNQLDWLSSGPFEENELPTFREKLESVGKKELRPVQTEILQLNVGYMCNQTCKHCHVDAGPDRKEIMTREVMEACINQVKRSEIETVDITGGAPEMNPHFRWLIGELRKAGAKEIIVRSNLTIIEANKKYHDLPTFFADNEIRVVSSLPFYKADRTDRQRGKGVFEKSIRALKKLNAVGYGRGSLKLDLVYNPSGAFLPAAQSSLEKDFKNELLSEYDIVFDSLLTITNLPISRFLEYLIHSDNYEDYMDTLVTSFNPATLDGLMCRNTLSVGWDGRLFDCDFNQMLDLSINNEIKNILELGANNIMDRNIVLHQHCYGCTAGAGSSCQGTLT